MKQGKRFLWFWLFFASLTALVASGPASPQTTEPILRLEVGTHNAGIFGLALDPANRILLTGSEDKTVRVWDISGGGKLLRTLRPPVGEWEQGNIFAVALSPDAATVACGGRTGSPKQGDACVYLFDRATGALTHRLGGLPGWVQHLAYTSDGRFLVAVMGEGGGKASWAGMSIFRLPDYTLVAEDRDYGDFVKWTETDPTGPRVATACYDGFIRLYDLSGLTAQNAASPCPIVPVSRLRPAGGPRPWGLAFSPDGTRLAVGFEHTPGVEVLQVRGNTLGHAYSPDVSGLKAGPGAGDLRTVAWSRDGRFLYAGGNFRSKGGQQVRKWADGGQGKSLDLPVGVDLSLFHILPLRAGGIIYASRDGSFGALNDRDEATLLGPQAIPIYRHLNEGFRLSPDGAAIQFAYERSGKSAAVFSLNMRSLTDSLSILWVGIKANVTFQAPITEGLEISDWKASLSPKLNGRPLPIDKHDLATSLAVKPDRSGFIIGAGPHLYFFDSQGKLLWRTRLPSAVFGVNTNGQIAVAALGDGTIRWYRLENGQEYLAFFPHPDRKRWILWTPSGYYDASPGAEDFIGWHLNNGKDRAGDFFPASRFRSTYYRPDVIDRIPKTLDEAVALQQANEELGRKQAAQVSLREKLPPVVTIVSPADGAEVSATPIKVRYSVRSHEPLTGLKVLVDGRPVSVEGLGKPLNESGDLSVSVPSRDCNVSIIAENRNTASEPATVRLRWKGAAAAKEEYRIQPKLYVLAVGISRYDDPGLRLGLAAKDALDFGAVWAEQKGQLYSSVEARVLTDAQATKGNILDGLDWLQRQVTQHDVAMLFFAGHGVNDPTGVFYFLPVDSDVEKLKRTGISQADITSTVAAMAGKVLVFIDACHSGNLMEKVKRRGNIDVSAVINELASAENGAVVFSSATGRQYALEKTEWGNGAFTKGLVEGIRGKANYGGTGRITLNMLDLYVSERVKSLTQGEQTPTTVKPPNVPDFPVAVLAKPK